MKIIHANIACDFMAKKKNYVENFLYIFVAGNWEKRISHYYANSDI